MAIEVNGELILNHDETAAFVSNMIHPNANALRLRDEFLRDLEAVEIDFTNGEISAKFPAISLPIQAISLYDEKPSSKLEASVATIHIEQRDEVNSLSTQLFVFEEQSPRPISRKKEEWTTTEKVAGSTIFSAA